MYPHDLINAYAPPFTVYCPRTIEPILPLAQDEALLPGLRAPRPSEVLRVLPPGKRAAVRAVQAHILRA